MYKNFFKKKIKNILVKYNYSEKSKYRYIEPIDLRDKVIDPFEAYYISSGKPFIMNLTIDKCFAIGFHGKNSNNPFVSTLRAYGNGICNSYTDSPLKDFYQAWNRTNTEKKFEGAKGNANPWDLGLINSMYDPKGRLRREEFTSLQKQLNLKSKNIFGHISGGPVSEEFGQVTFKRLTNLYDSIKKHGYEPEKLKQRHITARFFINHKNDFVAEISSGKHRFTVLQSLGHTMVPIQFGPPKHPLFIREEEINSWPNVKNGLFAKEEALQIFHSKFSNSHPSNWKL
jgi:hypothetical protein